MTKLLIIANITTKSALSQKIK